MLDIRTSSTELYEYETVIYYVADDINTERHATELICYKHFEMIKLTINVNEIQIFYIGRS